MKLGKVSQTVYRRSILKQIQSEDAHSLITPSQEEHCFGLCAEATDQVVDAEVTLYGNEKDLCVFAILEAANHLWAKGVKAEGITVELLLPEYAFESRIKSMISSAKECAKEHDLHILRADAQVVPNISTTIVHVTAIGTISIEENLVSSPSAGQELVMFGYMGLSGALRIKREKEEELKKRFVGAFLDKMETYRTYLYGEKALEVARNCGATGAMQVTDGGVLAALWNFAERAGAGLAVDMRKIPVKQETIELCECYQLNPYQMSSIGAFLVAVEQGEELVERLHQMEIPAAVIGRLTDGNDRVILSGGEVRYLDKPAADELVKIFAEEKK